MFIRLVTDLPKDLSTKREKGRCRTLLQTLLFNAFSNVDSASRTTRRWQDEPRSEAGQEAELQVGRRGRSRAGAGMEVQCLRETLPAWRSTIHRGRRYYDVTVVIMQRSNPCSMRE